MLTSARWLNDYLDLPATPEEQAELLTQAGFPLEDREDVTLPDGSSDVRQDYEMTSNRGDAVCHVGLAREIAAISGRTLKQPRPQLKTTGSAADSIAKVTNHEPKRCPRYTGRIIRGVKVGPSPRWLQDRLIARGDIPRNNVVDATNFVLFELGQPTHVFDLAKLKGPEIIVRLAKDGEPFLPIGEGEAEVKLTADDLVIADAEVAVAIGGVKGGAITAVTDATTDLLLEAASFDPVSVRNSSRRLNIASDSSYRFERGVHPGQVDEAAERLAELILELAGGELCQGVLCDGAPIPEPRRASMRPGRCRKIIGLPISDEQMLEALAKLGFEPSLDGDWIRCIVPYQRLDIEREIDLIEEVSRIYGHDNIPVTDTIQVRVAAPQATELAKQAVANELVGMGFIETITHSLTSEKHAALFKPPGMEPLRVADERAKAEPVLQPSTLPSLLRVYALNRDNGVTDVKLFEQAATFGFHGDEHLETTSLGLLIPTPDGDPSLREMRGVIDRLIEIVIGHDAQITLLTEPARSWLEPFAAIQVNGRVLGTYGLIAANVRKAFDIDVPVAAAEIGLPALYEAFPPETPAHALPSFPAIERDLSPILDESVTWAPLHEAVRRLDLRYLEAMQFVTTYRGKGIPKGRKSLTFRLRFRAPDQTLKHAEVDPQVDAVVDELRSKFNAELRG
jgi:phenylalanyl-tRNA synthetase beta chain